MPTPRLTADTRAALFEAGLKVISLYQQPQRDGRKLDRCAQPTDPWFAALHNKGNPLVADLYYHGSGQTADDAVLDAIGERSNFGPLEAEIDKLLATLQSTR